MRRRRGGLARKGSQALDPPLGRGGFARPEAAAGKLGGVSLDGEPLTSLAVPAAQLAGRRLKAGKSATSQGRIKGL